MESNGNWALVVIALIVAVAVGIWFFSARAETQEAHARALYAEEYAQEARPAAADHGRGSDRD